jgi:DNA topoisomerase-1
MSAKHVANNGRGVRSSAPALNGASSGKLRYVLDRGPGITRKRQGHHFVYRDPAGKQIADRAELDRIKSIAVPPAWTEVWICPIANGHIQATGRDARGRKQYRYHPLWRKLRDADKYAHVAEFAVALPLINRRLKRDLAREGLPRDKVLAAVVRLMQHTLARAGNVEYEKANNSFGITTLKNRHVRIRGGIIEIDFNAKSKIRHHSVVSDRKLARILRNCRDLPGSELFQFVDDKGVTHSIDSGDLNDYLRQISGRDITAKDFRTWAATNLAMVEFANLTEPRPSKKTELLVVSRVAKYLGNTPSVCRKCYIHPTIIGAYHDGSIGKIVRRLGAKHFKPAIWTNGETLTRLLARSPSEALVERLKDSLEASRQRTLRLASAS